MRAAAIAIVLGMIPAAAGATEPGSRGADFLAARQGTWRSVARADAVVVDGWEWVVGSGRGAANTSGVAALGLWEAWEADGVTAWRDAAMARAGTLSGLLSRGAVLHAPDLELVARVTETSGDRATLEQVRRAIATRLEAAGGPAGEVARLTQLRGINGDLAGYDVAQLAEAAMAAGLVAEARALVMATYPGPGRSSFGVISLGALAAAASIVGVRDVASSAAVSLLASQGDDGAWRGGEVQATAFAVRGLALFSARFGDRAAGDSGRRGRAWLEAAQLGDGAWGDLPGELAEVHASGTAEVVRALVAGDEARPTGRADEKGQ